MTRNVLAVLYQYPPDNCVGAQSSAQICRYLPDHGWNVSVLTVRRPNSDSDPNVIRTRAIPHVLDIYKKLKPRRTNVAKSNDTNSGQDAITLRRRILTLLEIPDTYTGWILPAVCSGLAAIRKRNIDVVFSSGPWWTNHLVAMVLSRVTGLPWIAHFRDTWAQGFFVKPTTPLSLRIERALEKAVVRNATAVVSVTSAQTEMLRSAYCDLPVEKFATISNGYDEREWCDVTAERCEEFTVTYAGNFYHGRSPYPLFKAVRALLDRHRIAVRIELLGVCDTAEGKPVIDVAREYGIAEYVSMPGVLDRQEAIRRMKAASVLLLLVDEQNYSIPGKTYEYLRAGRPILALTTGGAVVDVLKSTGGSWTIDPSDIAGIEAALLQAYAASANGSDARVPNPAVVRTFDRRVLTGDLAQIFAAAAAQMRASTALTMRPAARPSHSSGTR